MAEFSLSEARVICLCYSLLLTKQITQWQTSQGEDEHPHKATNNNGLCVVHLYASQTGKDSKDIVKILGGWQTEVETTPHTMASPGTTDE